MLAIPGKNPVGNVLHLVIGPESEMIMDIQGAQIMDVTPLINKFDKNAPVFVSLTRSRSEKATSDHLKQTGVPHAGAINTAGVCDGDCDNCDQCESEDAPGSVGSVVSKKHKKGSTGKSDPKDKVVAKTSTTTAQCSYCKRVTTLLPIAGFKICMPCAQIELVLKAIKKVQDTGDTNASVNANTKTTQRPI